MNEINPLRDSKLADPSQDGRYLLWVAGGHIEGLWGVEISKKLSQHGFKTVFLTNMRTTFSKLKETGCECYFLNELAKPFKKNFSNEELEIIERRYSYPGFNLFRNADETIKNLPFEEANSIIASYYRAVEHLFEKYDFYSLIMFPTTVLQGRIPYSIAKGRNLKILMPFWGPVHNDTFVIGDLSEEWIWSELYNCNCAKNDVDVKGVVNGIEKKLMAAKQPSEKNRIKQLAAIVLGYINYLRNYNKSYDFESRALVYNTRLEVQSFKRFFTKYLFKYDDFYKSLKYVFFPLHCHFDSTLTVANPLFIDQLTLVKNVSKCLPVDYKLYVKEHPYDEGYLTIKQLKELKQLGNVIVLHPAVRSINIIKNASAIVTISSSAGWESFLFKKPVIAFGKSFYSDCPLVYKVSNIRDLRHVLWQALDKGDAIYEERADEYNSFINRIINTSRPGNSQGYKSSFGWQYDSNKNAERVALGLLDKLKE